MHAVDVSKIDLNLLPVLALLLQGQSVTATAKALNLTQPTVSHSLGRLRDTLGDPLLVRVGRGMVRTPKADALLPLVERLLVDVRSVFATEVAFDRATSNRSFTVASPDLVAAALPELLGRVQREAPHVRIEVTKPPGDLESQLAGGAVDSAILPARTEGKGLVQRVLGTASWCVLARRGHPAGGKKRLDVATWLAHPSVLVRTSDGAGAIMQALTALGHRRHVAFVAPSFLSALHAVAKTDSFFAAPKELVCELARELDLVVFDLPVPLKPLRIATVWHERMSADVGHTWLRNLVSSVVKDQLARGGR